MKPTQKAEDIRSQVLLLLSDNERTRVSTSKNAVVLADGDEYIDLAAPENGVRTVHGTLQLTMGQVLPEKAVSGQTWARISARFGTRFVRKQAKVR